MVPWLMSWGNHGETMGKLWGNYGETMVYAMVGGDFWNVQVWNETLLSLVTLNMLAPKSVDRQLNWISSQTQPQNRLSNEINKASLAQIAAQKKWDSPKILNFPCTWSTCTAVDLAVALACAVARIIWGGYPKNGWIFVTHL